MHSSDFLLYPFLFASVDRTRDVAHTGKVKCLSKIYSYLLTNACSDVYDYNGFGTHHVKTISNEDQCKEF